MDIHVFPIPIPIILNLICFILFSPLDREYLIESGLVLLARSTKDPSSIDSDVSEASAPRDPVLPKLQLWDYLVG